MALLSNINNLFSVDSTGEIKFNDNAGTSGYVLVSAGTGAPPVWTDRDTGGVIGTGTENKVVRWNAAPATGDSQTIGDGPITFSGSAATANSTFGGDGLFTGTLTVQDRTSTASQALVYIDGKRTNGTDGVFGELVFLNNGDSVATVAAFRDTADNKGSLVFQTQNGAAGFGTRLTIAADGNATFANNIYGNSSNTTEIGAYDSSVSPAINAAIKRIRMTQGGEIHFGDTTTAAPLGITEGNWNSFGDNDFLSIYGRSSIKLYSGATASAGMLRLTLDTESNFEGNVNLTGNLRFPNSDVSSTAAPTNFGVYTSEIRLIETPNGGLQKCRVITDNYGEWILVGRFAASAMNSIANGNSWSSESGLDTGTAQNLTTKFSADFGDSFPTEVRIMGATDFTKWRDTRTVDFIYGVPEGREWKYFFSGGAANGMTSVGPNHSGNNKFGWNINGSYDGFGRWANTTQTSVGMSDNNVTNPSAAYTTATTNAFNWDGADDAKITVSATRTFSGQDSFETAGFGNDDNIYGFFDEYPNETNNMQGGVDFSSAVWVLIKLPNASSGGASNDYWSETGTDIYNTNSGNVGVGTSSPGALLQVGETPTASSQQGARIYGYDGALNLYTKRAESPFNAALYLYNNPVGEPGPGTGILFRARTSTTDGQVQATIYSNWTTSTHASRTGKLVFQTCNAGTVSDKMTILGNGNVGIGTTLPQSILSLSKTDEASYTPATAVDYSLMLGTRNGNAAGTSDDLGPGIVWKYNDAGGSYTKKSAGIMQVGEGNYLRSGLAFYTNNNADQTTAWSEKMRLSMDGNVGIGTAEPGDYDSESNNLVIAEGVNGTNPTPGITIACLANQAATGRGALRFADGTTGNERYRGALEYNHNGDDMFFRTSGTVKMTLDTDGNVGIGLTNPSSKLTIETNAGDGTIELLAVNASTTKNKIIFSEAVLGDESFFIEHDGAGAGADNLLKIHGDGSGGTASGITIRRDGRVGIGTNTPRCKLEIFRAAGSSGIPQLIVSTGEGSSRDYSFGTDVMAAGDFAVLDGVTSTVANVRMRFVDGGTVIAFRDNNTTELGRYVNTTTGGSIKRIRMCQGGEIHFGDTSTSNPLGITEGTWDSFGDSDLMSIYARNRLNIYAYPTGNTISASFVSGTFTAVGDVVAYGSPSDKRLKENIKPIESALDKVNKLQGVTFDWKKSDSILEIKEDIGFIAQDVQKVIPELVRENEDGMLSMRHQGIAPILLEAIKELKAEIEELKSNKCNCNK